MTSNSAFAPGKIIVSGEYAVVFGKPGIATPARQGVHAMWTEGPEAGIKIALHGTGQDPKLIEYLHSITNMLPGKNGMVLIRNELPIGRGMGSSTAFVIAICKAILGDDCKTKALEIEDAVNPGHSGLDFAVIWDNKPLLYKKGEPPTPAAIDLSFLDRAELIDTGQPNESTPELVAWVTSRKGEPAVATALKTIGNCTQRLIDGESPLTVWPDHHKAQVALGIVPADVQKLIAGIEKKGGAAKILGAGSRSGGGGMVLALKNR